MRSKKEQISMNGTIRAFLFKISKRFYSHCSLLIVHRILLSEFLVFVNKIKCVHSKVEKRSIIHTPRTALLSFLPESELCHCHEQIENEQIFQSRQTAVTTESTANSIFFFPSFAFNFFLSFSKSKIATIIINTDNSFFFFFFFVFSFNNNTN